jgi:hypothetical protein
MFNQFNKPKLGGSCHIKKGLGVGPQGHLGPVQAPPPVQAQGQVQSFYGGRRGQQQYFEHEDGDADAPAAVDPRIAARAAILATPPAELEAFSAGDWLAQNQLTASMIVVAIGAGLYYSVSCRKK